VKEAVGDGAQLLHVSIGRLPFVAAPLEEEWEGAATPPTPHCFLPLFLNLPSMTRGGYATFLSPISHLFCFWACSLHKSLVKYSSTFLCI
jgi:hypothetical protein